MKQSNTAAQPAPELNKENPFFVPFNTLHDTFPFQKIKLEHYEEAFIEGMRRDKERIQQIIDNPEKPTFKNTVVLDDDDDGYYDLLENVSTVFGNLMSAETSDEMQALAMKLEPILTQHSNDISMNPELFKRVAYVYRNFHFLGPEEKVILKQTYDGFVRSGALLDEAGKERLRQLTEQLGMLSLQFSENSLKEKKAFSLHLTNAEDLSGLPQTAIDAAAQTAKERGLEGWVFTLDSPSYTPFMQYSNVRRLRQKMYMAYNTLGINNNEYNNVEICRQMVNLKQELAQLLGYKTYADYALKDRMAGSKKGVMKFLNELIDAYKPSAEREYAHIVASANRGEEPILDCKPWDMAYLSNKERQKRYELDPEMLRPYLKLDNVIKGVFGLAQKLYGITFHENNEIQVYHPDVKAYEVKDEDGSFLAVFYADFFPREGKQGGAWMTEFQGQWIDSKGENVRPHVSVVMNFTKPTDEKPALLTLGEVETFLHEFGHALHAMFANTHYEALSGTNVFWDFVEFPSQFMEYYAIEKDFLHSFAFHYETGEVMPDELIKKITDSRNFMVASSCMRQVSFGLLDMAYHSLTKPLEENLIEFEKQAWQDAIITPQLPDTCMTTQFSHIMAGGYAAGYYSYKWAEVIAADAFSMFQSRGIFNRSVADKLRQKVLSKGGTKHPMVLFKSFRGRQPSVDALLRMNGLRRKKTAKAAARKSRKQEK